MNLYEGTFLRRYKRFFADIKLDNGDEIVAHVANTGSMKTCLGENFKAFVTHNDDPKRKLKYTLEYIIKQGFVSWRLSGGFSRCE